MHSTSKPKIQCKSTLFSCKVCFFIPWTDFQQPRHSRVILAWVQTTHKCFVFIFYLKYRNFPYYFILLKLEKSQFYCTTGDIVVHWKLPGCFAHTDPGKQMPTFVADERGSAWLHKHLLSRLAFPPSYSLSSPCSKCPTLSCLAFVCERGSRLWLYRSSVVKLWTQKCSVLGKAPHRSRSESQCPTAISNCPRRGEREQVPWLCTTLAVWIANKIPFSCSVMGQFVLQARVRHHRESLNTVSQREAWRRPRAPQFQSRRAQ